MSTDPVIHLVGAALLVPLAFILLRRFQAPKPGTDRLAITVWAAFGPHATAREAEDVLRRAGRVVFGSKITDHEEWIQGHVENFHTCEREGRFQRTEKLMRAGMLLTAHGSAFRAACSQVRADALDEAQGALDSLGQNFPEILVPLQTTIDCERGKLDQT